jgi:hypothetical protein
MQEEEALAVNRLAHGSAGHILSQSPVDAGRQRMRRGDLPM